MPEKNLLRPPAQEKPGIASQILDYISSNARGQPEGKWLDRQQGQEAIYAEPQNEMLQSASSGTWRAPLMKMMKYLSEEGGITLGDVAKRAGLSRYESDTLKTLFQINRPGLTNIRVRKK